MKTLAFILAQDGGQPQGGGSPAPATGGTEAPAGGQARQPGFLEGMGPLLMFGVVIVVFMIFMSRSKRRQEAEHKRKIEDLQTGARVMLTSGLIARVDKIDKENQEARLVIDEEKKVHGVYNIMAIAKIFDEKQSTAKEETAR
ncbi:MAG: preprotein translocase subunit YajC [Planctomycetes bacterium]|nr:preprotein translocase subunit YajC [Planctomycetota bacterium]MCW8134543.1 preprotein translocase subunit YajC [Planctomycetota bacterium]